MSHSILITQCLQNDFVKPIGRHDPIPNLLHVGFEEAQRLMGEDPAQGPVARVMQWADDMPDEDIQVIHIRDWHDPADPAERSHLEQFGEHCIRGTDGAAFAFDATSSPDKNVAIVDSLTLNDFIDTNLAEVLEPHRGGPVKVGLIGVWTEAKVSFLAYELCTRYPEFELGVCSALTASSSRSNHFIALDQLERLLGVAVFPSAGRFTEWLGGEAVQLPLIGFAEKHPEVEIPDLEQVRPTDHKLLRYLFRDCNRLEGKVLDGGYSGNLVLGIESVDLHGHRQAPHVVKIGPRDAIGAERTSFEQIETVLGNAAPRIADFADLDDRGAIKYRYASMGGGSATTFQKQYMAGLPMEHVERFLKTVFGEQLGRLYGAATRETMDPLAYYEFSSKWAGSVRHEIEALIGRPAEGPTIRFDNGAEVANVCEFYEKTLDSLPRRPGESHYVSFVHGDLNGANIIIDENDNVWLIDFFHAHRGHVLRDLVKMENDLLYIFTPVRDEQDLAEAFRLTDLLFEVRDLAQLPPDPAQPGFRSKDMARALETVKILRSFYPELVKTDRDPLQLVVAQLRYAVHTLGFFEADHMQKLWALYTAGRCVERITKSVSSQATLRVDWLEEELTSPGKLGLTLLPGRLDYGRDLAEDLDTLIEAGVTHFVSLVPQEELVRYGVSDLLEAFRERGIEVRHQPIVDQKVISPEAMADLVSWMAERIDRGANVLVTCVGGLGRSGTAAACYLKSRGLGTDAAIAEVRRARSPRAIESKLQEDFVTAYAGPAG